MRNALELILRAGPGMQSGAEALWPRQRETQRITKQDLLSKGEL